MSFNISESKLGETVHQLVTVDRETIGRACQSVIRAMQTELPEEARSIEIFDYVLKESREMLHSIPLRLE